MLRRQHGIACRLGDLGVRPDDAPFEHDVLLDTDTVSDDALSNPRSWLEARRQNATAFWLDPGPGEGA